MVLGEERKLNTDFIIKLRSVSEERVVLDIAGIFNDDNGNIVDLNWDLHLLFEFYIYKDGSSEWTNDPEFTGFMFRNLSEIQSFNEMILDLYDIGMEQFSLNKIR
jgi:hypothetical protein